MPDASVEQLVRSYLLHFNFEKTLAKLEGAAATATRPAGSELPVEDVTDGVLASEVSAVPDARGEGEGAATAPSSTPGATAHPSPSSPRVGEKSASKVTDAAAPNAAASSATVDEAMRRTMARRRELQQCVLQGDTLGAIELAHTYYPGLLDRSAYLYFRLRCQHFLELLRRGTPMEAVTYAQRELSRYHPPGGSAPTADACRELEDAYSLIAYQSPSDAPPSIAHLMSDAHRAETADCLNGTVLEENGVPRMCAIERLLRQLVAVSDATRDANAGYGACLSFAEPSAREGLIDNTT
jgi:hypothetical protein